MAIECVNRAYEDIFLLWQFSFSTHYVIGSFRHKRKGSSPPPHFCWGFVRRKEWMWERQSEQSWEEWGFQRPCCSFGP